MKGIDISNWQSDIQPSKTNVDFCICKSTEGLNFVDKYCNGFIEDCKKHDILWGFYHFAGGNNPEKEAEFFYKHCKNYFGKGIPVLDFEIEIYNVNYNNCTWCERFLKKLHDLSGVWALLYISASRCPQYESSWIPEKCGLWVAGYPQNINEWTTQKCPYDISPWNVCAIWQFTNSLILPGYVGKLDGDIAYMNANGWMKYAKSSKTNVKPVQKSIDDLVLETLLGEYGTGEDRKKMLGNNYDKVQKRINELYKIADEVIDGKWGNGWNRETALNGAGYPANIVQKIVNMKLA